jgi:hypothetical protein
MSIPTTIVQPEHGDVLRVTLRYDGPDVADGSIAADDIVSAIQGFAGAYEKLRNAKTSKPNIESV